MLDVNQQPFPQFDFREEKPPHFDHYSKTLNGADGIVFVTPEYNGGMSGALKNAMDHFRAELNRKPMGAVTVSSGPFGGLNALHNLYAWMLYNGGIPCPTKLLVSHVGELFNEAGEPTQEIFNENYPKFVQEFSWLVEKISQ